MFKRLADAGETVSLKEYLEQVWAAVSKEALWKISKTLRVPLSQLVREV